MKIPAADPKMRAFLLVWAGQLVSLVGSGMTTFALGMWVYLRTGSATQFALIAFFATLPGIVALPLAGALVDQWGGRRAMIVADVGEALCTLAAALLLWSNQLGLREVYAVAMVSAVFGALRWPAYSTLPPLLIAGPQLSRANGLVHLSEAVAAIAAPVLAGILITVTGLGGVLLLDAGTYLLGLASLMLVRLKTPTGAGRRVEKRVPSASLWGQVVFGWNYIRSRPGLWALLVFFAVTNFTVLGLGRLLFTPLLLGFTSPAATGVVLSIGGVGFLAGAALMALWGGPKRRIHGVLGFTFLQGVFVAVGGLRPNLALVATAVFMTSFCFPIVTASSQTLWQTKVARDVQGRVFSVRRMLGWSSFPLAYLVAGPLADRVFEPLLNPGGAFAGTVGRLVGTGPGRGIAFLLIILGLLTAVTVAVSYRFPRLRLVEDELPDALSL